ncbi:Calcium-dependent lipid-binding (CaLB domain) family protein [Euphorbia peplus]|nr:Calcium-dependent lipid-binding (CaLB domain) family protein [Euphorbia peplus]
MDSPQSVVSPFKTSVVAEPEKQSFDNSVRTAANLSKGIDVQHQEITNGNPENYMGSLEVYVHQARDIHNICIYHKQDVYAKLCLTSDPEYSVSTKIINGGGRNPVFNDNVRLNVKTVECSLKCEIFMMSRVRNYLEDQLLGFALVPLSEVLMKNGKLEKEFSLSSTDLFHSPAGFVELSLSYSGASPDIMAIPALSTCTDGSVQDTEIQESLPSEFEKMEFPDPKIVNENHMMVSEYFGISCTNGDSETSDSLVASDAGNHADSDGVHFVESFSADSGDIHKHDSPPSSVSTNGVSSPSAGATSHTSDSPAAVATPTQELDSSQKDKGVDVGDGESDSTGGLESEKIVKPVITVNLEPEQNMVQQDIVDMYMKSMQQFTESLAKMKLPLDMDNGPTSSGSSTTSDQKTQASKNNGSRVFYGSRAFF